MRGWPSTPSTRSQSDSLQALLDAHRDQVRAGAEFPDGGYWTDGTPAGDYGEEAHWQRFVDAYIEQIKARPDCGAADRSRRARARRRSPT